MAYKKLLLILELLICVVLLDSGCHLKQNVEERRVNGDFKFFIASLNGSARVGNKKKTSIIYKSRCHRVKSEQNITGSDLLKFVVRKRNYQKPRCALALNIA